MQKFNRNIIEELIEEGKTIEKNLPYDETTSPEDVLIGRLPTFKSWGASVINYVSQVLQSDNSYVRTLHKVLSSYQNTGEDLLVAISTLKRLLVDIDRGVFTQSEPSIDALHSLNIIFNRFNQVVRQLRKRYNNRSTLDVQDEYDVQDLLYALLRLYFEDIEPEDYVPKYAGKGSRCDFALRDHNIIVEVKKTRNNLKDKEIGEELTLDIAKYSKYPNLKHLICFVYDPEGYIRNVKGLENDLGGLKNGLNVHINIQSQ